MNSLSSHTVVDQMVGELAERRRNSIGRKPAYLALARAILSEPTSDHDPLVAQHQPTSIAQSAAIAA